MNGCITLAIVHISRITVQLVLLTLQQQSLTLLCLLLQYALKIDKQPKDLALRNEHKTLRRLQAQPGVAPQLVESGTHGDRFFIVMELLGKNLYEVRRAIAGASGRLSGEMVMSIGE